MASHIGKLPVTIPAGVEVAIEGQNFSAKGAKGSDSVSYTHLTLPTIA